MGQRTSVYFDDDLHAAAKASGVPLAERIRRGLAHDSQPAVPGPAASPLDAIGPGEPSPGVLCMGPGCLEN